VSAPGDLLAQAGALVDVASVSHAEAVLADRVEAELRSIGGLAVERVGDNVVARTDLGRPQRLLLGGHLDTVAPAGNERAVVDGDVLHGVGAADMKGGLAVFLALARTVPDPAVDVTWVLYACEEVSHAESGLGQLFASRPDLLVADAAVLGEPTGGRVEAGCQGTLRVEATFAGRRAHTARPWMGVNAIQAMAPVLTRLAAYEGRRPVIDGCEYREAVQAVRVEGGSAGNVVPDRAVLTVNHRFAPDRSVAAAQAHVEALLAEADEARTVDAAGAAPPGLGHPLLRALLERSGAPASAKLGWTDVARFAEHGTPATNFGPGDATVAHTPGEHVTRAELERVYEVLAGLLTAPPGG
jgi:succinyl-diaminopimelate desuccinylase